MKSNNHKLSSPIHENSTNFKTELSEENLKETKIQQIQNFINYLAYENEGKLPNHRTQKAERKLKNGLESGSK